MKFGIQSRSSSLILNMIFENCGSLPEIKNLADFVSKLQCAPTLKFGTLCKSNMLIINMVLGIDDLDPKI